MKYFNLKYIVGAIDGKHIRIKAPAKSGSEFYNYKNYFSIILLAICDANYRFVLVDIGDSGRHSDGGVFSNSRIGQLFDRGEMNVPSACTLPGSTDTVPYVLVGDDAFPLKYYLMKPYPGRFLGDDQNIYNYRVSRARRCVENAFGILAVRWQMFYGMIQCDVVMAERLVKAAVVLHNYLQQEDSELGDSCSPDGEMTQGLWRQTIPSSINLHRTASDVDSINFGSNNSTRDARAIRNTFCRYFNTTGAVDWQWSINS